MFKPLLVVPCLFASYFVVFFTVFGGWGRAVTYGVYGSIVFSITLFVASFASQGRPWLAFWIANIALILLFGGPELYFMLTPSDSHATRFDGRPLSMDGNITAAGFASLALDLSVCTLSNFMGFYLAHRLKVI